MIDALAESGKTAREMGTKQAVANAFSSVLSRLVLDPDETARLLADTTPDDYLDFVHIRSEKTLPMRYIAELDICFNADRMRNLFWRSEIAFAELPSASVVILPVFAQPSGVRLWDRTNKWISGWEIHTGQHDGLLQFVSLPEGLLTERQLSENLVYAEDRTVLATAAKLAGAQQLLWVLAELDYSQTRPQLMIKARLFDAAGQLITPIASENLVLTGQQNMGALFDQFQRRILADLETRWRQNNQVKRGEAARLVLHADLTSLAQWRRLQNQLSEMAVILRVTPISLSASQGTMELELAGSVTAFREALNQLGLDLKVTGSSYQLARL